MDAASHTHSFARRLNGTPSDVRRRVRKQGTCRSGGARLFTQRGGAGKRIRLLTQVFEQQLKLVRQEKETLLKEIHHRVKNNMQLISSMLHLQAEAVSDPVLAQFFIESQSRVKTMAMIHEKLYQSKDLSRIDFSDYLRTLALSLLRSYGLSNVTPVIEAEEMILGVNLAIPCGLIVNELISNTMKYAFPSGGAGRLHVTLARVDDHLIRLTIGDDGVGLPAGLDPESTTSLGLKLVHILVQQLNGALRIDTMQGTRFVITFPEE